MSKPKLTSLLFLKTESRYKNKLTTESCFHLHKILDSVFKEDIFKVFCPKNIYFLHSFSFFLRILLYLHFNLK